MSKTRSLPVCAYVLSFVAASTAVSSADTIYFTNGDVLTGKVTAIADGKLTVNTPATGDVKIDLSQVKTFSTDGPLDVKLADGTILRAKLSSGEAGQVMATGGMVEQRPVKISSLSSFPAVLPPIWTGNVKFGGLLIRGNTDSETLSVGINADRKTEKDEFSFAASYLYGRTKDRTTGQVLTTEDNWQLEPKYTYNLSPKLYDYGDLLISRDRLQFLDLRINPTLGLGYRWLNKPDITFATELGIGWIYEKYTNDTPTREDASLQLAYHFMKKFNDKVSVLHNLTYSPSVQDYHHFLVETDVELRSAISKHWFTDLKIELDYDSTPAIGAFKNNVRYELDLGYNL